LLGRQVVELLLTLAELLLLLRRKILELGIAGQRFLLLVGRHVPVLPQPFAGMMLLHLLLLTLRLLLPLRLLLLLAFLLLIVGMTLGPGWKRDSGKQRKRSQRRCPCLRFKAHMHVLRLFPLKIFIEQTPDLKQIPIPPLATTELRLRPAAIAHHRA